MERPADRHRHLEDADDAQTRAWTCEQNARARRILDALPQRPALTERFAAALALGFIGPPTVRGGRAFFMRRCGEQDQAVLAVRQEGAERILLDPAALDPSGLTALDWWYPSPRGRHVAFGLSRNGDERSTLYVLDVEGGRTLDEAIPETRFCSLAWYPDESGFFYTRYPARSDYEVRLFRHELGGRWEDDPLIFGEGRAPEEFLTVTLSEDGRWLIASASTGWVRSELYLCDLTAQPPRFVPLVEGRDANYEVHAAVDRFVVRTDEGAPGYRVFAVDPERPQREAWRELVPERSDVLVGLAPLRGGLILHYLHDVQSRLRVLGDDGRERELPSRGSVLSLSARASSPEAYALRADFVEAPSVERITLEDGEPCVEPWDGVTAPFDPRAYAVEQAWFTSRDGTRVPMFVVSRAGLPRDGRAPAILSGYGGFNVPLVPAFVPEVVPWLDAGGVYAVANLRGGSEFGEAWHRAGMRERKQNVFDDFIAAAVFLGSSGIADPSRIAIMGGSNGGLLVAAALVQRPELFRAVVCAMPLTDMLRFHQFSLARVWISEYGDPDDPVDAAVLRAYSPYHNVHDGVAYTATLVITAESDTRVDPMHARKFAARLQEATGGDAPVLLYVEPAAGHGAGKPRHKKIAELADKWSFLFSSLDVEVAPAEQDSFRSAFGR